MILTSFMDPMIETCCKCGQDKENTSEIGIFQDGLESIRILCDDCVQVVPKPNEQQEIDDFFSSGSDELE